MKFISIILFIFSFNAFAQKASKQSTIQQLMQDKVVHSQSILRALATEDFATIKKEADLLKMIGKAASWHKIDQPEFKHFHESFQNAADNLSDAAAKQNLDAVGLSYMQLTFSCMQCHRAIRDKVKK